MATLDGVNPALVNAFLRLQAGAAAAGYSLGISSGYRTPEHQARLRRAHCCYDPNSSKCSCGPPTAPPGRSNHQHGLAIDISGSKAAKAWANAHGAQFGVHFPVAGEDWHMELIGGGEHQGHIEGASQGGIGFDVNFLEQPSDEGAVLDAKLGGIMDVMVGAHRDAILESGVEDPLLSATTETDAVALDTNELTTPTEQKPVRMESVSMPGAPGAPGAGGTATGQWAGGVPPPGYVPPGEGVERWRGIAEAALRYTGQTPTKALVDRLLMQMASESGGNPTAVNNYDSNAQRGDPSKGLMQNIGSAFPERARELANRGIYDGFANIVASIRYSLGRYGSLERAWRGHGY
jgi:hypothetical protein